MEWQKDYLKKNEILLRLFLRFGRQRPVEKKTLQDTVIFLNFQEKFCGHIQKYTFFVWCYRLEAGSGRYSWHILDQNCLGHSSFHNSVPPQGKSISPFHAEQLSNLYPFRHIDNSLISLNLYHSQENRKNSITKGRKYRLFMKFSGNLNKSV